LTYWKCIRKKADANTKELKEKNGIALHASHAALPMVTSKSSP
jgi:hypothetical protein